MKLLPKPCHALPIERDTLLRRSQATVYRRDKHFSAYRPAVSIYGRVVTHEFPVNSHIAPMPPAATLITTLILLLIA